MTSLSSSSHPSSVNVTLLRKKRADDAKSHLGSGCVLHVGNGKGPSSVVGLRRDSETELSLTFTPRVLQEGVLLQRMPFKSLAGA